MTTREEFSGGTVDQLLLDAGHLDVPELRAALVSIASLAQMQAPAPGPELAAMLAGPRNELTRQRWLRKHRPAVVGLAVLAGMGLGVSGVAATNQGSGGSLGQWSVQQLTSDWTPGWKLPVPPAAAGDRPAGWASPLFLQIGRVDAASAQVPGKQATQSATPDSATLGPAGPPASAHEKGWAAGTKGLAAGAASHGKSGPDNHGQAGPAKAVTGQAPAGHAPEDADGEDAAVTPDAGDSDEGERGAGETADAAPTSERTDTVKSGGKLDSTVDSALDSVSSWLGKFRR